MTSSIARLIALLLPVLLASPSYGQACIQHDLDTGISWCLDPVNGASALSVSQILRGRYCNQPDYVILGFYNCQIGHNSALVEKTQNCRPEYWVDTAAKFLPDNDPRRFSAGCGVSAPEPALPRGSQCVTNSGNLGRCATSPAPIGERCTCPDGTQGTVR
jgi:hypothetical protein